MSAQTKNSPETKKVMFVRIGVKKYEIKKLTFFPFFVLETSVTVSSHSSITNLSKGPKVKFKEC